MDNKEETKEPTKKCKKCRKDIDLYASICPYCRSKQSGTSIFLIIIIIIGAIVLWGNILSSLDPDKKADTTPENIEYIKVDIDTLEDELEKNAAVAQEKYDGQYLEISGRLSTIDSDLDYISLVSPTDEWDLIGVHCTIKNKKTEEVVKTLTRDQNIIVKGKITDVGEVLGYYLDIDEIIPE